MLTRLLVDGDNNGGNVAITMALTNYQRQKRWREKNRAIYNLRRRNRRKDLSGAANQSGQHRSARIEIPSQAAQPAQPSKIDQLRQLISKPIPAEPAKPVVFKDDYGRIISEHQWRALQRLKTKANDGGYEIDDYTQ